MKAVVRYEQSRGGRVSLLISLSSRRQLAMVCWHRSCRLETLCSTLTTYNAGPEAISRRESLWPQQIEMMGRCMKRKGRGHNLKRSYTCTQTIVQQVFIQVQNQTCSLSSSRNLNMHVIVHKSQKKTWTSEIIDKSGWYLYHAFYSQDLKCFTQGVVYRFHHPDGENEALRGHVT